MSLKKPLPIKSIFLEALSLPARHWQVLLKAGTPLIVLLIASGALANSMIGGYSSEKIIAMIVLGIGICVATAIAIVACHRVFLLGDEAIQEVSFLNWTGNELRYIGWWVIISILASIIMIPIGMVTAPFMATISSSPEGIMLLVFVTTLPLLYIISRWSILLPGCAIGLRGRTLSEAWSLSDGNGWRLTVLVSLLPTMLDFSLSFLPCLLYTSDAADD